MKLTIETDTGTHTFTGDKLEVKSGSPTIKIIDTGRTIAVFRDWLNWRMDETK